MSLLSKVKDIFKGGSSAKKKKIYHNVRLDNPEDYWDVIGELGDGAYGKVYKAQRKDTGQLAALKQVDLEGEDDLDTFMVEIDILCECRHPNIVELIEAYHFDGNLWMYLEYCDGGAVDSIMVDLDRALNEPQIALLCYHLCNALQYIHANKVIHRDLKAGNVLLTTEGGVKLADFGVSAKNKNTFDKRGTFIGTPYWLAPEVILCETFIDAKYDYKADIWSLGISLIEFAQMDPPNHDVSPVRVMLKIQKSDPPKLDFPSKWSKEFNDFIAKCLTKDPVLRPTAEDLLRHPFLCKPLDKKPITDLLLEYKADVVEEDVEDENEKGKRKRKLVHKRVDSPSECNPPSLASLPEDQDPCRMSSISEPFADSSRFDAESVISVDKDNALSVPNDKLPSPSLEDKEINSTVGEKRISKKPAPPPPIVNLTSPKKGPAPAIPSPPVATSPTCFVVAVSTAVVADSAVAAVVSTASSNAFTVSTDSSNVPVSLSSTIQVASTSNEVSSTSAISSPVCSTASTGPAETKLISSTTTVTTTTVTSQNLPLTSETIVNVSEINSATSTPSRDSTSNLSHTGLSDTSPDKYIPEVLKKNDLNSGQTMEENFIDSIPVGKRVYVYDTDTYDTEMVTVNNASVGGRESVTLESKSQPVIQQDAVTASSDGVTIALETEDVTKLNIVTSASSHDDSQNLYSPTAPVTLSIVSPQSTSASAVSEDKAQASDVLLASISSEGTVIVRTPTPTPVDSTSKVAKKSESKVTYTVAKDEQIEAPLELDSTVSIYHSEESRISLSPEQSRKTDNSLLQKQQDSLGEAEAQAVLILETAINSAMDSSFSGFELLEGTRGVMVIASEKSNESLMDDSNLDSSIKDISGHKLDESEVLITNASIPEDEEKESPKKSIKSSPEAPLNESLVSVDANEEAHHVSVVSVDEGKEVTVVSDGETSSGEVVVDGPETTQMSLTIEGTTLEDTDVDEVENSASSAVSTLSNQKGTQEKSVINATEVKKDKLVSTVSSASTIPSSPVEEPDSAPLVPLQPIQNGIRRHNSRASDRSDTDTTSTVGSDKENRHTETGEEVTLRRTGGRPNASPVLDSETAARNLKNKELQASIALRKKTRKRTRKFVIDGVVVTTTTSKVIYGDDEEQGMLNSAHLARKQELRELKLVQKREQKQFQDLALKANIARVEQEKKFEIEKANLLRNYDSQVENLIRQQKQLVEKAEGRQETELKIESKKTRIDQERELKAFRESLKQEWKLLKQEVDLLPKDKRKENFKVRKEQLERDQMERERACLERLNDSHEMALKRLNDKHRKHIALKERQFLEEKHQLLRARESALWDMEERHIQDKHQLAKEQLKDIYFLQRLQMTIRHNVELEQVRRFNQQKEEELLKRQHEERRQLPKRIRQEMKTREKMFREQMRISMTLLPSHEQEKEQIKKFQEQEKIKYDKERKRAEMKHKKQMEELTATTEASIKELVHLQNEKGKLLTEHETYKLKSLDEEYQKELREWKSNLAPRKQKLEEDFERQLREQENFYGEYLERGLGLCIPAQSMSSLTSTHH